VQIATATVMAARATANSPTAPDLKRRVARREIDVIGRTMVTGGACGGHGTRFGGLEDRVSALDGRLALDSPPGGGTRACVRLPAAVGV
jgi:hypothetical protein